MSNSIITPNVSFDEFDIQIPYKAPEKKHWTDWLPHTANLINQVRTTNKLAELLKKYIYPKETAALRSAVLTNDYITQQLLEKKKQEAVSKIMSGQSSNMQDYNEAARQAATVSDLYDEKIAAVNSLSTSDSIKTSNTVNNWNANERMDSANKSVKTNAVAYNNLLNAESTKITTNASNTKDYIYDMYTDAGKFSLYESMLEADLYLKHLNLDFAKVQNDINSKLTFYSSIQNWGPLSQYLDALRSYTWSSDSPEAEFLAMLGNANSKELLLDPKVLNWVINLLNTGTDEVSQRYKAAFEEYVSNLKLNATNKLNALRLKMWGLTYHVPTEFPTSVYKKGGSLKEVEKEKAKAEKKKYDYLKAIAIKNQKEDESVRKRSEAFHKRSDTMLSKQLGALDKEQLMLLKSIFQ